MKMRFAFTMIELIFAIVVISIVALSLPMMSHVINKSHERNLVQEAILLASGDVFKVISGKFDENSKPDNSNTNYEKILYTDAEDNDGNISKGQRAGNINILFHENNATRASVSGLDTGETAGSSEDDVDDYALSNGDAVTMTGSAAGYKQLYKKDITVTQHSFNGASNTNAKKVEITIKDQNDTSKVLVKMHTYTFNTGSVSVSPYRDLP